MYKIKYKKEVENDLNKLDKSIRSQVFNKIEKISQNPKIGINLNGELSGYKKVYISKKKIRIIYKIIENRIEILIIAIGKRENNTVYKSVYKRIL